MSGTLRGAASWQTPSMMAPAAVVRSGPPPLVPADTFVAANAARSAALGRMVKVASALETIASKAGALSVLTDASSALPMLV